MVRCSLVAILAVSFAAPVFAGPVGTKYVNKEAIVINSDIPPGRTHCVEGQPCWRGRQAKPKNLSGPRDKRGPPAAFKGFKNYGPVDRRLPFSPIRNGAWLDNDEEEDSIYDEPARGYGNGYIYGHIDKNSDRGYNGYYGDGSDAQKTCNCLARHKGFDGVLSHIEEGTEPECAVCAAVGQGRASSGSASNIAARSESDQIILGARIPPPSTAAIANGPKYAAVCIITQLSQMCIAAGNAVCSPEGILDAKDARCARACNCVRL